MTPEQSRALHPSNRDGVRIVHMYCHCTGHTRSLCGARKLDTPTTNKVVGKRDQFCVVCVDLAARHQAGVHA